MKNPKEKMISDFIRLNGFGKITLEDYSIVDTFVYGYFKAYRWHFIVHQDVDDPEMLSVSEASTGCCLHSTVNYEDVEDALYYELPFINTKKYYFATSVGDFLVKSRCNLLKENLGVRTLAIDTALWI